MLFKKIILFIFIAFFINLAFFVHVAFILPIFVLLHLLFNETDFFYGENSIYEDTDLSKLFSEEAGPFEIVNDSDKVILFVHGYPSCPATFKYVAPIAAKAGYDVYAPLLPGFGTNKEDFIKSNFSQWFIYLCGYYQKMQRRYDKVYVVGLSLGGSLTLKLAEKYSGTIFEPDGISIAATPVFLNSIRQRTMKSWLLYFIRSISWFVKFIDNPDERWKQMEDGHSQWIGYRGKFPAQIFSMKMAFDKVRTDLKKITAPVIAFHVPDDRTVNYKNLTYIEKKVSSARVDFRTLDYKGYNNTSHCLFLYESIREEMMSDILDFFDKVDKEN